MLGRGGLGFGLCLVFGVWILEWDTASRQFLTHPGNRRLEELFLFPEGEAFNSPGLPLGRPWVQNFYLIHGLP